MTTLTGLTFGGTTWTPQFVQEINQDKCIGCGRCFKACGRNVLQLRAMNEDGEFVDNEEEDEIEHDSMIRFNGEVLNLVTNHYNITIIMVIL